jgi:chaperonin cofactor prefoldin
MTIRTRSQYAKAGVIMDPTNICAGLKDSNQRNKKNIAKKISKDEEKKQDTLHNLRASQRRVEERFNQIKTEIITLIEDLRTFILLGLLTT